MCGWREQGNDVTATTRMFFQCLFTYQRARWVHAASNKDIEVAVMIVIHERNRATKIFRIRNLRGSGDVSETSTTIVVIQTALAVAQHEQIGASVVVIVTRDHSSGDPIKILCQISRLRRYVDELAAVVPEQPLRPAGNFNEIEITVAIEIKQSNCPARLPKDLASRQLQVAKRRQRCVSDVSENHLGSSPIDQLSFRAGGNNGFSVMSTLEIVCADCRTRTALSESLKLFDQDPAFFFFSRSG